MNTEALGHLFRCAVREGRAGLITADSDLELPNEHIVRRGQYWWKLEDQVINYDPVTCMWISWSHEYLEERHPELWEQL